MRRGLWTWISLNVCCAIPMVDTGWSIVRGVRRPSIPDSLSAVGAYGAVLTRRSPKLENVSQLFITDKKGVLLYAVPLEDLILFDFNQTLKEIIAKSEEDKYKPHVAVDNEPIETVVETVENYDMNSIAVVDSRGYLLGRITTDDIHDFIKESATEQIYNLAGVDDEAEEEDTNLAKATRARAIWLLINLFTALISSSIIGLFDETIASYVTLAVLMPIVASMGGNTGTQALTVTVRRLTVEEQARLEEE